MTFKPFQTVFSSVEKIGDFMKQCKDDNIPFDQLALVWSKVEASNAASQAQLQQQQMSQVSPNQLNVPVPAGISVEVPAGVPASQIAAELPPGQIQNVANMVANNELQNKQDQQPDFHVMSESSLMNSQVSRV